MIDLIEVFVNKISQIIGSSLAIEYGASLWQERKFSKKRLFAVMLVIFGVRLALKFFR